MHTVGVQEVLLSMKYSRSCFCSDFFFTTFGMVSLRHGILQSTALEFRLYNISVEISKVGEIMLIGNSSE